MPTINYDATGTGTESAMDDLEAGAKSWRDGESKILHNIDKRYDVGAVQINISWEVADGGVDEAISQLDNAINGLSIDLPAASEAARVEYSE